MKPAAIAMSISKKVGQRGTAVLPMTSDAGPLASSASEHPAAEVAAAMVKSGAFEANVGSTHYLPGADGALLVGVGEKDRIDAAVMRRAGFAIVRSANAHKLDELHLLLTAADVDGNSSDHDAMQLIDALGEGVGLAGFRFDDYRSKDDKPERKFKLSASDASTRSALQQGLDRAEAVNVARTVAATPPNVAKPSHIAEVAKSIAKGAKTLRCRVIEGDALAKHKLAGLINVGRAADDGPRMIELVYDPAGGSKGKGKGKAGKRPTVLLVGKTITYDTGGLSLKVNNGMKGMKYDKCGGMAVLGIMHALRTLKVNCRVVALLPTAENSVASEAYRPDDIITFCNGVSVEVTNTDAEGRLVLADGLAWGCATHKPNVVVDLATLTGGVVVALGNAFGGLFSTDDALADELLTAGLASGDRLWRLPLDAEYSEMMKSKHADLWNSAPVRAAHPIQGAAFLQAFVPEGTPWAHLDIAGMATTDKDKPPFAMGPTGFGTRVVLKWLMERYG